MASGKVTQTITESVFLPTGAARVTQSVVEVLIPVISRSPTTPTGAGVTKSAVELLLLPTAAARVTASLVEVLILDSGGAAGSGGGGTVSFGYAV